MDVYIRVADYRFIVFWFGAVRNVVALLSYNTYNTIYYNNEENNTFYWFTIKIYDVWIRKLLLGLFTWI